MIEKILRGYADRLQEGDSLDDVRHVFARDLHIAADRLARLAEAERRISEAPKLGITLRTNGGLDIKNIDALQLTVGQAGIYRLVLDSTADSADGVTP